jgi:hypothetical protein
MLAEGTITESDYVAAQFLHIRPRPIFAVIGILLVGMFAFVLVVKSSLIKFGILAYFIAWFAVYIPWQAKRVYRQYHALSKPVWMEIREDGLYFKRENAEGLVPWSEILKWRHGKRLLLLYPASNVFHIVPSHFFATPEAYVAFVETVKARLGNST